ncbi:MAG: L-serine ammonia-lyase, iron-sulfur-dependent, subunit alpha [Oscillospiraceae bacterium]|nr:L-serine ammonia-lyase, iron-sulfur-dependent, subunit alpha [Oscillospiraceae bacterium]
MRSIRSVYKIGNGPSSSHTVGPYNAARLFLSRYPAADGYEVILYGSLAYTGEGHGTGKAIRTVIPGAKIVPDKTEKDLPHPNTMLFRAFRGGEEIGALRIMSVGGGSIRIEGETSPDDTEVYAERSFHQFRETCQQTGMTLLEYIYSKESPDIREYLLTVWNAMQEAVRRGLDAEGVLPGGLNLTRKARHLYSMRCHNESSDVTFDRKLAAYAFAVSEENADEQVVVTAPTCGSCGIIPAVFYYMKHDRGFSDDEIVDALAVAGLIGNIIRTNASVSGAECGCQAEIGSACSMAAAGLAQLFHLSMGEIEYSAEIAMEHQLGLTCDPVRGLVQIPCIERNAIGAMRVVNAVNISRFLSDTRRISLDEVIATMYETGIDMNEKYRETAHGGLAQIHSVYEQLGPDNFDRIF